MRRKLILILCLCVGLTGCKNQAFGGDAGGWKENTSEMTEYDPDGSSGSSGSSQEVTLTEYHRLNDDYFMDAADVDEGIEVLRANANEFYTETSPYFVKTLRLGDDGSFELWESLADGNDPESVYTGTYTVGADGGVEFEYKSLRRGSTAVLATADDDDGKAMQGMNATGSYPDFISPPAACVQKNDIYGELPIMRRLPLTERPYAITSGRYDMQLYRKGTLLCTDLYGVKLKGSYERGKDFTLSFTPSAIYTEDPLYKDGAFYSEDQVKESLAKVKAAVGTDGETEISFSGGKWVWKAGGKVVSSGTYSDSDELEGFVRMKPDKQGSSAMITWFYITDGGIYYPFMIETKQVEK